MKGKLKLDTVSTIFLKLVVPLWGCYIWMDRMAGELREPVFFVCMIT